MSHDLIVLGAGPAGASAAIAAAGAGLAVALIDEQHASGGQVWRAPWVGLSRDDRSPERRDGDALRAALAASTVDVRLGRRVWSVGGAFRVDALGPDDNETFEAARLVAATGAYERVVPFPGWTLPGVIGLAAATILLKSHAVVPTSPMIVAGCGPLLAAAAAGIIKAGGTVAAVVDLAGPDDWLRASSALLTRPTLMAQGLGWVARIAGARVPVLFRHGVREAEGESQLQTVLIGPVDAAGAPSEGRQIRYSVATLVVGHGLVPGAEVPRLFRSAMRYEPVLGGHVPVLDAYGRTSIPGLFAAGDGAGIRGAAVAVESGRLAGLAAAADGGVLGSKRFEAMAEPSRAALRKLQSFSGAMAAMMALRPGLVAGITPDTIVCRCEDVTRGEIDAAADAGATDVNQLKHFTRCGMGPCQGRICGDVAAELLAHRTQTTREAVGQWTARPPLRPVSMADLLGRFDYADIPIPSPAPL